MRTLPKRPPWIPSLRKTGSADTGAKTVEKSGAKLELISCGQLHRRRKCSTIKENGKGEIIMLNVDISNIWGDLSLPELLQLEAEVNKAHKTLAEGRGDGSDFLGWLSLPTFEQTEEISRIRAAAKHIRETSDVFVVVGSAAPISARVPPLSLSISWATGAQYRFERDPQRTAGLLRRQFHQLQLSFADLAEVALPAA
jgi:hypothetical protein